MSKLLSFFVVLLICHNTFDPAFAQERLELFDEITKTVVENFYSPVKVESVFRKQSPEYRLRVTGSTSDRDFAALVNQLLDELQTSTPAITRLPTLNITILRRFSAGCPTFVNCLLVRR